MLQELEKKNTYIKHKLDIKDSQPYDKIQFL